MNRTQSGMHYFDIGWVPVHLSEEQQYLFLPLFPVVLHSTTGI